MTDYLIVAGAWLVFALALFWLNTKITRHSVAKMVSFYGGWVCFSIVAVTLVRMTFR